jgi:hypothetical protein
MKSTTPLGKDYVPMSLETQVYVIWISYFSLLVCVDEFLVRLHFPAGEGEVLRSLN